MNVPHTPPTRRSSECLENLDKERKQLEIECDELLRQRDEVLRRTARMAELIGKALDQTATPEERAELDRLRREGGPP